MGQESQDDRNKLARTAGQWDKMPTGQ
jgi:hypothetical protein